MPKVLVVATSRKTRGGITSVVKAHETGEQWQRYHCKWVETHRDGPAWRKVWYFITSFIEYIFILLWYDIVHIHLSEPPSALRKLPFMWLAKLWKKKTIVHFHSFSVDTTIGTKWGWVYQYHFGKADVVITLSEYWRQQVTDFLKAPTDKVRTVYNPCPDINKQNGMGIFADSDVQKPKQSVILYAGTITPRKGYTDMIRAFAKIAGHHRDWMILFAGNGEIEKGQVLAEDLGISSQVLFLGWCSGADKDRAFREAKILCLPSYAEGFPMAVLDAWTYGLPVITTPVGGIPDVAKDGQNMLLFKPGDIDGLANCMERMITDTTLREMISKASISFAQNEFNAITINHCIGSIYEELSK